MSPSPCSPSSSRSMASERPRCVSSPSMELSRPLLPPASRSPATNSGQATTTDNEDTSYRTTIADHGKDDDHKKGNSSSSHNYRERPRNRRHRQRTSSPPHESTRRNDYTRSTPLRSQRSRDNRSPSPGRSNRYDTFRPTYPSRSQSRSRGRGRSRSRSVSLARKSNRPRSNRAPLRGPDCYAPERTGLRSQSRKRSKSPALSRSPIRITASAVSGEAPAKATQPRSLVILNRSSDRDRDRDPPANKRSHPRSPSKSDQPGRKRSRT
ncbi:hypothetical protein BJ085DRAFT_39585, partial [Dimargaris cristalligena]